jgi:hypothetical protein
MSIDVLKQRLLKARAALKEAKRRERQVEEQKLLNFVKTSGLTLIDVQKLAEEKKALEISRQVAQKIEAGNE